MASAPPNYPVYPYPSSSPVPSAPPMEDDPPLPTGWEKLTEASGRIYYGNPYLKIVQYDRPGMNNPIDFQYFQNELISIEKETKDLDLALTESNLEYIIQQVNQLKNNLLKSNEYECDKQCQNSNESIEQNTLDEFLSNDMNSIFKENK